MEQSASSRHTRLATAGILLLVLLASAQLMLLAERNAAAPTPLRTIAVGERLPDLSFGELRDAHLVSAEVSSAELYGSASCTIVILFASDCQFVKQIVPQWQGVNVVTRGDVSLPVIWLATTPTDTAAAEFLSSNGLPMPGYRFLSRSDAVRFGANATPEGLIVDRNGTVLDKAFPDTAAFMHLPAECSAQK